MNWIAGNIKWLMIVSGALTCTMAYAALAPQAMLQSNFGQTLDGPVAEIVVRNWGMLITTVGVLMLYGAFKPAQRTVALTVATLSKLTFIALVLVFGRQFLSQQIGVAVAIDAAWVLIFGTYLIGAGRRG